MRKREAILCFLILISLMIVSSFTTEIAKVKGAPSVDTSENELCSELSMADLDWISCIQERGDVLFNPQVGEGYAADLDDNMLHAQETTGTFDVYVGWYTVISIPSGNFSIELEGKAKAGYNDAVRLFVRTYNSFTKTPIESISLIDGPYGFLETDFMQSEESFAYTTEFIEFEQSFSYTKVAKVVLYFFYSDAYAYNWEQEFWIKNLVITAVESQKIDYYWFSAVFLILILIPYVLKRRKK